ncbi:platelet binding protein GspB isoform X2 [Drosophila tropicalis]|uniref:platelet binding protein GspB isoform X2 n=1 Tax=Drosophila tropicalis TaxID=46794 RepID=UPI0035ABCAA3
MTTETMDVSYERVKNSKRPLRPKVLKLTDVTIPHRSRKKIKVKSKDRSTISVRERIYDDPAYTEDISHLANPMRRSSISGKSTLTEQKNKSGSGTGSKHSAHSETGSSSLGKRSQLTKEFLLYAANKQNPLKISTGTGGSGSMGFDVDSSSSENEPLEPIKGSSNSMTRRVRSLERSLAMSINEKSDKKALQKRSSKQKRNLSLDNNRQQQVTTATTKQSQEYNTCGRKERSRMALDTKASELDDLDDFSVRSSAQDSTMTAASDSTKMAIGRRFLRGEIGIKSFNYYLLKEGLKSSKKLVDKQRNTASSSAASENKLHARSEENIYEEIFFKDTIGQSQSDAVGVEAAGSEKAEHVQQSQQQQREAQSTDCEICMQQCNNESCEYCLEGAHSQHHQQPVQPYISQAKVQSLQQDKKGLPMTNVNLPAAHILEFQSYNPNNPGVYKMETTPVAITGDYNPVLQFQQSTTTATTTASTSVTTTPSEQMQQHPDHTYGAYYSSQNRTPMGSTPLTNHYAVSGINGQLLLAAGNPTRRPPQQQQHYIVSYQNANGLTSLQRLNTKSSSSSDSLPYHNKYNTMTRLEANVLATTPIAATGDIYYAIGGVGGGIGTHSLMYAASRPMGGSQILVDSSSYDPPHMYKSDSKASILSEFSLRSSDNSQRYLRYPSHGRHSHGHGNLLASYGNAGQRRYFGSTESCRFGYDCRRCSLDGVIGTTGSSVIMDKCSYSDNCRYGWNCDCSSSYFSSDFDDMYSSIARGGSSGIPRKTAAGTLPSTSTTTEVIQTDSVKQKPQQQYADLKQNKYAQDFFKHVNDVKRSIYQSEMQRNNSMESTRHGPKGSTNNPSSSPNQRLTQELSSPMVTTLPLSRGRIPAPSKPTPAPRTSLQAQSAPMTASTPKPTPRSLVNSKLQPSERHEYPSLDRLVASTTGAIPKDHSRSMEAQTVSPKLKSKPNSTDTRDRRDHRNVIQHLNVASVSQQPITTTKRHHRASVSKSHSAAPSASTRRKDNIPAPPPPSPATYSDLQELKANMEGLQDDTKSRSLESETSETLTVNYDFKAEAKAREKPVKSVLGVCLLKVKSSILTESNQETTDFRTESLTPANTSTSGAEGEDDDVFYDARSEDSGGGVSQNHKGSFLDMGILSARDNETPDPTDDKISDTISTPILSVEKENTEHTKKPKRNVLKKKETQPTESIESCQILQEAKRACTPNEAGSKTKTENTILETNVQATYSEGQQPQTSLQPATKAAHSNSAIPNTSTGNTLLELTECPTEFEFSCKSDHTDSATLTQSNSVAHKNAIAARTALSTATPQPRTIRNQDFSGLDSSEGQSDDSHLTRDSVTRESQNDELEFSSSTLDKLDVSTLPLPALPKRRRTRSRVRQQRHEINEDGANAAFVSAKPEIGTVQGNTRIGRLSTSPQEQNLSAFQQYVAKRRESLEASNRSFNEKLEARKMHFHMGSGGNTGDTSGAAVPTYLFGEHFYGVQSGRKSISPASNKEEIYLNKSGWVQVNTKRGSCIGDEKQAGSIGYRRINYAQQNGSGRVLQLSRQSNINSSSNLPFEPKFVGSKVEELIQRNETRLNAISTTRGESTLRPGYRIIDPQLANILNERPGFLPVKSPNGLESPPPVTPILSPPPAFQDNSLSPRPLERRKPSRQQQIQQIPSRLNAHNVNNGVVGAKGMVFSRSFEYDTRRPAPTDSYVETFSRSFDGNLSERPMPPLAFQREQERFPNFSTLTGNSPNYLTKREGGGGSSGSLRSRDNSPKFLQPQIAKQTTAYLNASIKEAPPAYNTPSVGIVNNSQPSKYSPRARQDRDLVTFERSKSHNMLGRSRKSQFCRMASGGPVQVHPTSSLGVSRFRSFDTTINQRLNSCDSGARSDLSNDELDNDDAGSSEFLSTSSYQFANATTTADTVSISISPFKTQRQRSLTPDRNESQSHSSSSSLRKQRSLTPESRSITPEERRKRGSQTSSRQNSSSRNNTLERRQRHDEKTPPTMSRSSSSSSYSGGDLQPNGSTLVPENVTVAVGIAPIGVLAGSNVTQSGAGPITGSHRRAVGSRNAVKQAEQEHRIRRSRSLQLSERSPNRAHNRSIVCVEGQSAGQTKHLAVAYQQTQVRLPSGGPQSSAVFNSSIRAKMLVNEASTSARQQRQNVDVDKPRSFDFDYKSCNRSGNGGLRSTQNSGTIASGRDSGSNQNLRMERETRSFDDDYREGLRFLQPGSSEATPTVQSSSTRIRKSNSPVNSRSPQSSGSPQQNYGSRLCDHEMLRKSPIMNFRRGDSNEYELPAILRNRETINSGGNSELNFMSNETRIYEHPTTVLKPQRPLRRSPGSRDDLTIEVAVGVGGDYIYRQATSTASQSKSNSSPNTLARSSERANKSYSKTLNNSDYWPCCGTCQQATPGATAIKVQKIEHNTDTEIANPLPIAHYTHISTVAINKEMEAPRITKLSIPQWSLLCSGGVTPLTSPDNVDERQQLTAIVKPRVITLAASSLVFVGESASPLSGTTVECDEGNQKEDVIETSIQNNLLDVMVKNKQNQIEICRRTKSLPNLEFRLADSAKGSFPKSVFDIKCNTHTVGLSQQMRAVSSPALTDSESTQRNLQNKNTALANFADNGCYNSESGGFGVLQKFKRTFNNFQQRNQLNITHMPAKPTKPKSSPTTPTGTITAALPPTASFTAPLGIGTTAQEPIVEVNDASSGKYRFGPLIWRSSKERRKTKFNRRDKCNSGDSGIQVELEQDDHYQVARLHDGAANASICELESETATNMPAEIKSRIIRRTKSAKTSGILNTNATKKASTKSKISKHIDEIEREAPESLPTRSLSQPNGLEHYGIKRIDMEDSDSDSVASHDEASTYYPVIFAEVLYNFTAGGAQELGLERGTLIEILRKEVGPWWFGRIRKGDVSIVEEILDHELGWFPKEFVRIIHCPETDTFFNSQKAKDEEAQTLEGESQPVTLTEFSDDPDATMIMDQSNITTIIIEASTPLTAPLSTIPANVPLDNAAVLRRSAVRELLETEANYVKLLASICDGYLPAMSKRIDIFSPNSIRLIFSNISVIYKFQRKFLQTLRSGIEQDQIAKVFLNMHKGFLCYSTYCNAYPRALIELESYDRVKDARIILENCRESENLAELPLSAHLLAPVQRICRYPLHLSEIMKNALVHTEELAKGNPGTTATIDYEQSDVTQLDIPDSQETVHQALQAMRGITEAVNEGKRHSETIARHQSSFQNFKGPPLHLHSTRFFLQIDATRQKQNLWNSSYTLFLFDNQLVYCKRDIIKRSHFMYKGRVFLDSCRVVNVRDGKMFGHSIKNSLRIYCESQAKWYDFSFRSATRKHRFLNTLALERQFGGKVLYVSEMTGFEYNYDQRPGDYSDHSDIDQADSEHNLGGGGGTTSASGDSSVPESPAKYSDTLPKKSQSRDSIATGIACQHTITDSSIVSTGSLGRRRLGNWFGRKPKSSNCTPSQSPTHKPHFDANVTLTEAGVAAIELAEGTAALQQ